MSDQITYRIGAMFSAKGDLAAKVGAAKRPVLDIGMRLAEAGRSAKAFGQNMLASSVAAASAYGKVAGLMAGGGLAAGAGALAKVGFAGNVGMERLQNTIAGTLQLFNHSAGAADQLGTNIRVAGAALHSLNRIADESPGELQDIQQLFTNMLPGARAATGSMQRIMDLAQNVALFTPTFGGDFKMAGSQVSRMLTGGAGAEMEVWRTLQPVMLKVGQEMDRIGSKNKKIFDQSIEGGEKMTMAYNKLSRGDRLAVLEKSLQRGGPELAKMYKGSWEGASASAISGGRKVAMAMTAPVFGEIKKALIRAGAEDNSLLGKNSIGKLQSQAAAIGALLAKPVVKIMGGIEGGIRYLQDNFNSVFNRMYQAFQVGGALLRAAFAYGLSRMILGAAIVSASMAVSAGAKVGRGVAGGYRATRTGIQGVTNTVRKIGDAFNSFSAQGPAGKALSVFTMMGTALSSIAMAGVVLVPMLIIAAAAIGVMSIALLAVGGIAAYIASKWEELSASVVKGFNDGSITLRPLVIAALVLWERLKAVGESFIGGATGAGMMQWAIDMATSAVNGLAAAVSILGDIASAFLKTVAYAGKAGGWLSTGGKLARAGTGDVRSALELGWNAVTGINNSANGGAVASAMAMKNGTGGRDWTDKTLDFADKISAASDRWRAVDIKQLNPGDIEDWTKKADAFAKDLFAGDDKNDPKKKPRGMTVGTLNVNVDLRNTDPDRMMVGLMDPIRRLAKMPDSSPSDMPGF